MASPFTPATIPASSWNGGTVTNGITVDNSDGVFVESGIAFAQLTTQGAASLFLQEGASDSATLQTDSITGGSLQLAEPAGRTITLNTDPTNYPMRVNDTDGTLLMAILLGGPVVIAAHSAPTDGSLSAGQAALWFDDTNGAAKLMIKAKQANGTVKTGSVNVQT